MEKSYSLDTPASVVINDIRDALVASPDVVPRQPAVKSEYIPLGAVTARFPVIDVDGVGWEEVEALYLGHYGD